METEYYVYKRALSVAPCLLYLDCVGPTALHGINWDLKMPLTLGIASPTYSGHIPGSGTEQILWLLQQCHQYGLQSLQYGSKIVLTAYCFHAHTLPTHTLNYYKIQSSLHGVRMSCSNHNVAKHAPDLMLSDPCACVVAIVTTRLCAQTGKLIGCISRRCRWGGLPLDEPELVAKQAAAAGVKLVPCEVTSAGLSTICCPVTHYLFPH